MTNMTIANQNAAILANTARSEAAIIKNGTRRTIAQIQDNWNECVKQAGFAGVFETPVYYKLKKAIASFLERAAEQLDQFQVVENERAATAAAVAAGEIPAPAREEIVFGGCTDMDTTHAEVLEMNKPVDGHIRWLNFFGGNDHAARQAIINEAHTEALEENYRFGWLSNRFNLFWGGCDSPTRRSMTERAHNEALNINQTCSVKTVLLN